MMPFKNDLLWSPINKMTENNTKVTSKTRKVGFIGSTPYKVNKKSDKKQNKLMKKCFLMGTIYIYIYIYICISFFSMFHFKMFLDIFNFKNLLYTFFLGKQIIFF